MKRRFYFFCIVCFAVRLLYGQCSFTPLARNDFNLPSYNSSDCSVVREDTAGNLFVASIEMPSSRPVVHRFDGAAWTKLGAITNTNCSHLAMAVSKSGQPYIAFRDLSNGAKMSVMSYSAGAWTYVGTAGFSGTSVWTLDLKLDKNGIPVVVFQDQTASKGSAMKFNGSSWTFIGPQYISTNYMTYVSLALDSMDTPYVAYSDGTGWPSLNATVKKFDGVGWTFVGPQKFSASQADRIQLKFNKRDSLYIVYSDMFYSGNLTVKKFVQSLWVNVGTPGFTLCSQAGNDLAFDTSDVPHVLTSLAAPLLRASVMRFNGLSWNNLGIPGSASEKGAWNGSFIIDKKNRPVVAYNDQNRHNKSAVARYNGASWDFLGEKGFSTGVVRDNGLVLALDKYGVPYVCFSDSLNGYKLTVMKYSANTWSYVGPAGFSPGTGYNLCMKFDTLNVPYIGFSDGAAGLKQSVMKYNGTAWVYVGAPGFSPQQSNVSHLAFHNNVPHLISGGQFYKEIYQFNGSAWSTVFNAGSFFSGYNSQLKLAFDTLGTPFMLMSDQSSGDVYVCRNIGFWQILGLSVAGNGSSADMYLERSRTPYVALASGSIVTVKRFDGTNWVSLTNGNISISGGNSINIRNLRGIPYISYIDNSSGKRAVFLKFNGINWVAAASNSIVSAGNADFLRLENDTAGNFYVVYKSTEAYAKKINLRKTLDIVSSPSVCTSQPLTLNASGASSYTWSTGVAGNSIVVTPSITSTFYVSAPDANNCIAYAFKSISVPLGSINISGGGNLCAGSSATLIATGALSYTWNPTTVSQSIIVSPASDSVYTVSGKDNSTMCINTKTVAITIVPIPSLQVVYTPSAVCKLETVTITVSGAPYLLFDGLQFLSGTYYLQPLSSGVHTITGVGTFNCSSSKTIAVTIKPPPTISISGSPGICVGGSLSQIASGAVTYTWNDGSTGNLITLTPTITTTLSVTGTGSNNCVGSGSVSIQVYPLPVLEVHSTTSVICIGESATVSVSGANTYTWNPVGSGDKIIVSPVTSTTYTVTGTDLHGCSADSIYTLMVDPCTHLEPLSAEIHAKIFPNPNRGFLNIDVKTDTRIYIYDQLGRLMFDKVLLKGLTELDVQGFDKGIYFVKFKINKNWTFFKMVKE